MAAPPAPLAQAISKTSQASGVPADLLAGIWRIESGSTYPNPAVNSSGYGGLFGTPNEKAKGAPFDNFDTTASAQQQADFAAFVLGHLLIVNAGNVGRALSAYSGGGYSSVPGQSSAALSSAQVHKIASWEMGSGGEAPLAPGTPAAPGTSAAPGLLPDLNPLDAAGSIASLLSRIFSFVFSLRFVEILGGGILVLLGLYLLARQVGLQAPTPAVYSRAAEITGAA